MGARINDLSAETAPLDTDSLPLDGATTRRMTVATARAAVLAPRAVSAFVDGFTEARIPWIIREQTAGAFVKRCASLSPAGFPSSGVVILSVDSTASAKVSIVRPVGLIRDAFTPAVLEYKVTIVDAAVAVSNNECTWIVGGYAGEDGDSSVALSCDDGTAQLATYQAGVAATEALTLPVWAEELRIRLTIGLNGTTVETSADGGAWSTRLTGTEAPDATVFQPFIEIAKGAHAGERSIVIDTASGTGLLEGSHGALPPDAIFDEPSYANAADLETLEGDLATHAAASNPHAGSAPTSRNLTAGAGLTGGGTLAADRTFAADFGTGANKVLEATWAALVAVAAVATTAIAWANQKLEDVAEGTADTDAANVGQVQQPKGRDVSGASDALVADDIGNVVSCSRNGGTTFSLDDLTGSRISGRMLVLTLQGTHANNAITINPGAGVTIDGSTSDFVGATGLTRISLFSFDGAAWFSGG